MTTPRRDMPSIDAGDLFYEMWTLAHEGLSPRDSHLLDARLVLLLANRVGNLEVLRQCIELAAAPVREEAERRTAATQAPGGPLPEATDGTPPRS